MIENADAPGTQADIDRFGFPAWHGWAISKAWRDGYAAAINEGGQAPCESTDGCTRAQVTWEQAISHAGTDHAMAAQPVPPSPAQPRASCPKEARGELCSCYFSGPHSYCPFADGGPLASTAQGEPQPIGWTDGTTVTGHYVKVKLAGWVSLPVGTPLYAAAAIEPLRAELERERVRLAACGVAAMQNTRTSAKDRMPPDAWAWSASYSDVCRAVDNEMNERERAERAEAERDALRAERDALREDAERWSALRALWVNNVVTLVPAFDEIPPAQTRFAIYLYKGKCFVGSTPTAAIDAARKA